MDVSAEIHCGKCGSANYSLPEGADSGASIVCNDCATEMGTFGAVLDELRAQVLAHSAEAKRDRLNQIDAGDARLPNAS